MKAEPSFGRRNLGLMAIMWTACACLAFWAQTPPISALSYKVVVICWLVSIGWSVVAYVLEALSFYYYQKWFGTACKLSTPELVESAEPVRAMADFFPWAEVGAGCCSVVLALTLLGAIQSSPVLFLTRTLWLFGCLAFARSLNHLLAALSTLRKYTKQVLLREAELVRVVVQQAGNQG